MCNLLISASMLAGAKSLASSLLLGATLSFSNPGAVVKPTSFDASVYIGAGNLVKVSVAKTVATNVSVQLLDDANRVLHSSIINKRNMKASLRLNVDELPDGVYTLKIKSSDGSSIVKQINVGTPQPVRTIAMY